MKPAFVVFLIFVIGAPALAADKRYVIREGDTLASILRVQNYGAGYSELLPFIAEILQANPDVFPDGNANFVVPGSVIVLPKNPNEPEPEPEPEPVAQPVIEPAPEPVPEPAPIIPTIGSIEASSGRTDIERDGTIQEVVQADDLYARDVIFTRDNSAAEIILLDDTRISMGSNSEFSISEFSFTAPVNQGDSALGSLIASIRNGVIRTITGLSGKAQQNPFRINSSLNATIGIRGTNFTVRSCNDTAQCGDLYGVAVAVQDGSISFGNDSAEIELNKDEFAQVQSTTEGPEKKPLPEGFFDLQRDVSDIEVSSSWWEESIDYLKSLF